MEPTKKLANDDLRHLDKTVVWHAFSQMSEYDGLIIDSASGCWLTDIDGKRYLDGTSALWCNLFGHQVPEIDAAIRKQLGRVAHVTNLGMSHPATIQLAQRLAALAPGELNHVFFSGDGASAVEVAMKLAFQYWRQCATPAPERTKFIALGDAYHGDTIGTVSVSGVSRFQSLFSPLLFEVLRGPCPDSFRRPSGMDRAQASQWYLSEYRKLLERYADEAVAVIVEPMIQGAAGFVTQPPGFLRGMAELCREFGVLWIADEIAVGMGRTGRMFAIEHEGIHNDHSLLPDFLCLGKGLTGGYLAMSATLCSTRIWNAFLGSHAEMKTFFHGHTYGGNPLAAAAGNAVLDLFQSQFTMSNLTPRTAHFQNCLAPLHELEIVGDVRQLGMMAAVDLVKNRETKEPFGWNERISAKICKRLLDKGVWLRPLGNVLPILPPLNISDHDLTFLSRSIFESISEVQMELGMLEP
jgi:adenosylmethionine-8-amino-7-oxononanoate aminotransferase